MPVRSVATDMYNTADLLKKAERRVVEAKSALDLALKAITRLQNEEAYRQRQKPPQYDWHHPDGSSITRVASSRSSSESLS